MNLKLSRIRKIKEWTYDYDTKEELDLHKKNMIAAQFDIERENGLQTIYSQTIRDTEGEI